MKSVCLVRPYWPDKSFHGMDNKTDCEITVKHEKWPISWQNANHQSIGLKHSLILAETILGTANELSGDSISVRHRQHCPIHKSKLQWDAHACLVIFFKLWFSIREKRVKERGAVIAIPGCRCRMTTPVKDRMLYATNARKATQTTEAFEKLHSTYKCEMPPRISERQDALCNYNALKEGNADNIRIATSEKLHASYK